VNLWVRTGGRESLKVFDEITGPGAVRQGTCRAAMAATRSIDASARDPDLVHGRDGAD
jgi:hypothetical protein